MKISILLTGNELMSGDTVDTNSTYFAQSLKDIGLDLYEKRVVGDYLSLLVSSIKELSSSSDILIVNGGLGPTDDDLTAQALADAIDEPIRQNTEAMSELQAWAKKRDFELTAANLKQADLPLSSEIIKNPYGSAVGFYAELSDCLVICTPGVPSEFKPMVEEQVLPLIQQRGNLDVQSTITRLRLFGVTESGLQDIVHAKFPDWPAEIELGFRVQMPLIEVKLTTHGNENLDLNKQWTDHFSKLFSDYIVGHDDDRLPQVLNNLLREKGKKLTVAESCTGGLIGSLITAEAGSSQVFEAGYITYSNDVKTSLLGVNSKILEQYGAVSQQCVEQMLAGALDLSGADVGVAVSGIAGPDGGSAEKPVGTVWVAWGSKQQVLARRFFIPLSREAVQRTSAAIAMDLLRRSLLGLPTDIDYFSELKRKNKLA